MAKRYASAARWRALMAFLVAAGPALPTYGQGLMATVAGSGQAGSTDGPAPTAQFNHPLGVAVDAQGTAYVADRANHSIRKITAAGVVSTLAGGSSGYYNNPYGPLASFDIPENMLLTPQGNLLVADTGNGSIRQVTPAGAVTTFAGNGWYTGAASGPNWSLTRRPFSGWACGWAAPPAARRAPCCTALYTTRTLGRAAG